MADSDPKETEFIRLTEYLVQALRRIDAASLEAVADPAKRPALSLERETSWSEAGRIGARLKELGGLEFMHRAVRQARRVNARMAEALEDSWCTRVKDYVRVKWLP